MLLKTPSLDEWDDIDQSMSPSIFKIDEAKNKNWNHAKAEITHLNNRLCDLLGNETMEGSKSKINQSIVLEILGPKKEIGTYLSNELDLTEEKYIAFMHTFLTQAAYRVSTSELFSKYSLLKDSLAMEEHEYLSVWNKMSELKRVPQHQMRRPTSPVPIWQEIEKLTNNILKNFTVIGRENGKITISLDDDKVWFACSVANSTDLFNVKYTTHTQANRKGLVAHSAVTTGHMTPMSIAVERTKDTTVKCMKRMLTQLFDSNGNVDMKGVDIHSDRGYMIREIVDFLLEHGANFTGTVKRLLNCWPFTYNQKVNEEKDGRTLIDVKGAPTLFMKYCTIGLKRLQASAFRNGSQSVATAISSLHHGHEWEGTVLKPSEHRRWLEDEESLKKDFFQSVDLGKKFLIDDMNDTEMLNDLLVTKITPFTLRQGTSDWHWLRKFSLTSSQANGSFVKAFPLFLEDNDWINVATYLYGENWSDKLLSTTSSNTTNNSENHEQEEDEDSNSAPVPTFFNYISTYRLPSDASDDTLFAASWLEQNSTREYDTQQEAKSAISLMSASKKREVKQILASFDPYGIGEMKTPDPLKWLSTSICERDIIFYKSNALKTIMKRKDLRFTTGTPTIEQMIKAISGVDTSGVDSISNRHSTSNSNATGTNSSAKEETIKIILTKSFMPHQKGQKREHCSLGHRLEKPILKNFISLLRENSVSEYRGINIYNAFTAGLAAKKGDEYAKDSIDFVVSVKDPNDDDNHKLWGFEAKGRVVQSTQEAERDAMRSNYCIYSNPHVRISSNEAIEWIVREQERFQILQHAFVYDFDTIVLTISDDSGTLIRSYVVDFDTHIKKSFGKVLSDIKDLALKWAYPDDTNDRCEPIEIPDEVFNVADDIPTINGSETLQGTANLWHTLRKFPLPFPSMKRIIPAICAYWNVVKGGSDTTTKLMDDCILQIPKAAMNMETVCITRLLQILMVLIHRLVQLTNAKHVDRYPSLLHWPQAASNRFTFHKSLLLMANVFSQEFTTLKLNQVSHHALSVNANPSTQDIQTEVVDGRVSESMPYAPSLPYKTPYKIKKSIEEGTADQLICRMVHTCIGVPIKNINGANDKCAVCQTNTAFYCAGCKQWLCVSRSKSKVEQLYHHQVKGKKKHFAKVC